MSHKPDYKSERFYGDEYKEPPTWSGTECPWTKKHHREFKKWAVKPDRKDYEKPRPYSEDKCVIQSTGSPTCLLSSFQNMLGWKLAPDKNMDDAQTQAFWNMTKYSRLSRMCLPDEYKQLTPAQMVYLNEHDAEFQYYSDIAHKNARKRIEQDRTATEDVGMEIDDWGVFEPLSRDIAPLAPRQLGVDEGVRHVKAKDCWKIVHGMIRVYAEVDGVEVEDSGHALAIKDGWVFDSNQLSGYYDRDNKPVEYPLRPFRLTPYTTYLPRMYSVYMESSEDTDRAWVIDEGFDIPALPSYSRKRIWEVVYPGVFNPYLNPSPAEYHKIMDRRRLREIRPGKKTLVERVPRKRETTLERYVKSKEHGPYGRISKWL